MPTYDYRCTACSHTFEHYQSMKDAVLKVCPSCKKKALERLIGTGAAVLFKGSGFYQTDYRSKGYQDAAKKDTGDVAPASGSSDAAASPAAPTDKPAPAPAKKPKAAKASRAKE